MKYLSLAGSVAILGLCIVASPIIFVILWGTSSEWMRGYHGQ